MSIKFARCGLLSTLFAVVSVPPLQAAQPVAYVSSTGSGSACTVAQPCADFFSRRTL
jgi:hypothetical protein